MSASPCLSLPTAPLDDASSAADRGTVSATASTAGYLGLTVSSAMPGVIQLTSATEDPRGKTWTLQTMSGTTRFRTVFAVATCDRFALEAEFRAALGSEQVPHHEEFFHVPLRFARQILESEARAFPAPLETPARRHFPRQPMLWSMAAAVAVALTSLGFATAKANSKQQQAAALSAARTAGQAAADVAQGTPRLNLRGMAPGLR